MHNTIHHSSRKAARDRRAHVRLAALGSAFLIACPGSALAQDATQQAESDPGVWRVSTGVNYSEGDYGDVADTRVVSVPVSVRYKRGGFSLRVSVPYVTIEGPGSLLDTPQGRDPGFGGGSGGSDSGGSDDGGSSGSGGSGGGGSDDGGSSGGGGSGGGGSDDGGSSGGGGSGGGGSDDGGSTGGGTVVPVAGGTGRRSGIGDVSITLGYSFDLGETTYFDTTARVKIPTASRAKRLGTGKVDLTVGGDLVQDVGKASFFAGARYRFLNRPAGSTLRDTWGFGAGASYELGKGTYAGVDYDWQQSATRGSGPSSEVTGWLNFGLSRKLRMQVYASTGFTTNSTDFAGGLSISYRLN